MQLLPTVLAVLLSASASSGAPGAVTIAVDDSMKYSVTAITAKAGETLTVVIKSTGKMPKAAMAHNFVLLAAGTDAAAFVKAGVTERATDFIAPAQKAKVIAATPLAGAGETVEVTFTVPSKGTYAFICTFPGHFALGMKGTLAAR